MFNTIVLATDVPKEAEKAELTAIELARENKAKLVIAHVDERIAAKGDMPSVTPHEEETRSDAVDADVIVTGTRGRSSLTGLLVGSVTHKLLHISKRPVLAVPSD